MCFYCGTTGLPKKNQWNAYNAISSCAFGLSITRNLITRGLSICQAKLTQSKALKQTRFVALHNLWLLLSITSKYYYVSKEIQIASEIATDKDYEKKH